MAHATATLASPRADWPAVAHSDFRSDIEGLRGISVGAVVLFHAFPALVPGGFIGVDVFFVISGFLITRILLDEHRKTGRIDLLEFWCRRIRRIPPAATLALAVTAALVWLTPALDVREIGQSITAAALFFVNWRQAKKGVDYLAAEDGDNPAMHYWSLAVEEQFYLVWPILLAGLLFLVSRPRRGLRPPMLVLLVLLVGSVLAALLLAYSAYLTHTDRSLAFFSTFSRAWQLLAGALIAIAASQPSHREPPAWIADTMSVACLLILAASFLWIDASKPYPGLMALAPTAAAAFIIHASTHRLAWGGSLLSVPPLRALGRISFSLYLAHWPLIVAAHAWFGDTAKVNVAVVALSLALSAAAFMVVERPIRTSRTLAASKRKTLVLGALLVAAGALAGFILSTFGPDNVTVAPGISVSAEAIVRDRPVLYDDGCLVRQDDTHTPDCIYGVRNASRTAVLFGDSHAANWFPALEAAASSEGWRLLVRTRAACPPVDAAMKRADGTDYPACMTWRAAVIAEMQATPPSVIFVAASTNTHPEEAERRIIETLGAIAPTVVLRDTPRLPEPPVACLKRQKNPETCRWQIERLAGRKYPKTRASRLPQTARILDLNARLCPDGMCSAVLNGWAMMTDRHHLTARTSRSFADAFAQELRRAAERHPAPAP